MNNEIINKIAKSGIINLDLEDYAPKGIITELDIKDFLFEGLILKEKYFRESLKDHNWSKYRGDVLALFCSSNSIIPMWAYMLVTSYLEKNNLINLIVILLKMHNKMEYAYNQYIMYQNICIYNCFNCIP